MSHTKSKIMTLVKMCDFLDYSLFLNLTGYAFNVILANEDFFIDRVPVI